MALNITSKSCFLKSASSNYIANATVSTVSNVPHTRFTARAAEWIYDEIEGITNTLNCSSECNPGSFSVSGPDVICYGSSGSFSVPGITLGTTVTWSTSPSGYISGNTITPSSTTNTIITVTATIANGCGYSTTASKSVVLGKPSSQGTYTTSLVLAEVPQILTASTPIV